jgi:hypothetical protein
VQGLQKAHRSQEGCEFSARSLSFYCLLGKSIQAKIFA